MRAAMLAPGLMWKGGQQERELGTLPLFERSVFSFLPKLHKNPVRGVSTSPSALSLPNAAAETSATVGFSTGGGMQGRKPLLFLTSGVTLCPSLGGGVVASLGLIPEGRLGRGNQTLLATGATQHRGHEALRPVGEEPNSAVDQAVPPVIKKYPALTPKGRWAPQGPALGWCSLGRGRSWRKL